MPTTARFELHSDLHRVLNCRWKRGLDIGVAMVMLVVLAPVIALTWLVVLLTMGTPTLFAQERPGLWGSPFRLYKFRSMRVAVVGALEPPDRDRLTRVGRMLRATSLDELPSLWNVLRGEMSLVGPRPLLSRYLPYFSAEERARFAVRPGLTGLAQLRGRNSRCWDARLADDIEYVRHWSLTLDLRIMRDTVFAILLRRGVQVDPSSVMQDLDQERHGLVAVDRLGVGDCDRIAGIIRGSYDRALFECSPVFARGFSGLLRGQVCQGDVVLGIRHFGLLVGILQLRIIGEAFHINHFAIAPEHRGWGIGAILMSAACNRAGSASITLDVDSRNSRALAIYSAAGFSVTASSEYVLVVRSDAQACEVSPNPPMPAECLLELIRSGFCILRVPGTSRRLLYLEGRRVALDEGHLPDDTQRIAEWLGSGVIKLPARVAPVSWQVSTRWKVYRLARLQHGHLGGYRG
jgi:lipopolysaccharide/colanic/teichoic acid biosynthesis glycosyltransferase/GNAT superfamily N-acetyltransferase